MSNVPADRRYAVTHEWALADVSGIVTVGITDHAQAALGDVVFVELPEVGARFATGDEAGVVESVKAASDIYAPVAGVVIEVNEALEDSPELVNATLTRTAGSSACAPTHVADALAALLDARRLRSQPGRGLRRALRAGS
jgi:glycine cleavage system H protein